MTTIPMFPGFDGLMTLSRREGVDIRPTLLRVLTDLYVQTTAHTIDEENQFVELASRLIDEVDDATRAAVRARLSIYPHTPRPIADQLELDRSVPPLAPALPAAPTRNDVKAPSAPRQTAAALSMQPNEALELNSMFFAADSPERALILQNLEATPLKPAVRIDARRAAHSIVALERMALEADMVGFVQELAQILILPQRMAQQIVEDPGGEPLACAARALGMSGEVFERIILFLDPELGASVKRVYRLSRLYDALSERVALIVLAAWRGTTLATTRAKYQSALYDEERKRARAAAPAGTSAKPPAPARGATDTFGRRSNG
jgi:hypothetical protein